MNGRRDVILGQEQVRLLPPPPRLFDKTMERICRTCRHFRTVEGIDEKTREVVEIFYCKATSNYAYRSPEMTCRRWNYRPEEAIRS